MDVPLSAYGTPEVKLKIKARLARLSAALAIPWEAGAVFLEVLKLLATLALIGVIGLILLLL